MALDRNKPFIRQTNGTVDIYLAAAGVKIYQGALLNISSGYAIPATDTPGEYFIGEAEYSCDNFAGAAGDNKVYIRSAHRVVFENASASISDIGKSVYATSDDTFALSATSASACGKIVNAVDGVSWTIELIRV